MSGCFWTHNQCVWVPTIYILHRNRVQTLNIYWRLGPSTILLSKKVFEIWKLYCTLEYDMSTNFSTVETVAKAWNLSERPKYWNILTFGLHKSGFSSSRLTWPEIPSSPLKDLRSFPLNSQFKSGSKHHTALTEGKTTHSASTTLEVTAPTLNLIFY